MVLITSVITPRLALSFVVSPTLRDYYPRLNEVVKPNRVKLRRLDESLHVWKTFENQLCTLPEHYR